MTTVKQAEWDKWKLAQRFERSMGRGVATTIATVRKQVPCTCRHALKHHKKSGHCRPGCDCGAGYRPRAK